MVSTRWSRRRHEPDPRARDRQDLSAGGEEIHVLQGLNLDVDAGDFVAFMARAARARPPCSICFGGLDVPSAGEGASSGGRRDHAHVARKLTAWRARYNVGFVFQMYN